MERYHYVLIRFKTKDGATVASTYTYRRPRTLDEIKYLIPTEYVKKNWTQIWGSNTNQSMCFPNDGTCTLLDERELTKERDGDDER